ncbi:2246_t:CDS:2, partial [Paraglomus occultum]
MFILIRNGVMLEMFNLCILVALKRKHISCYVAATTEQVMDHNYNVVAWTFRLLSLGMANPTKPEFVKGYWSCCGNFDANAVGCRWFCDSLKPCTCAGYKQPLNTLGCTKQCTYCAKENASNGCLQVGYNNVEHDLPA